MKQIKRIMIVTLALVLAVSLSLTVFAATASQDGLELSVTTDKTSYTATEQVTVTVTVKNTNAFAVSNVAVESNVPDGYKPAEGYSNTKEIDTLGAGETATLTVVYVPQSSGQPSGPSYPTYPWWDSSVGTGSMTNSTTSNNGVEEVEDAVEVDAPTEGSVNAFEDVSVTVRNNVGLWVLIAVVSAGVLIAVLAGKKRLKKTMSIMLCIAMVGTLATLLPVEAHAAVMPIEAGGVKNLSAETEISVAGKNVNVSANVKWAEPVISENVYYTVSFDLNYSNADASIPDQRILSGDTMSIPESPERSGFIFAGWSTNKECSDMFMSYDEGVYNDIALYAYWVDENDLNDTDGDGLEDYLEKAIKTDITLRDTDGDGLTDYQEVKELCTDPLKVDSDGNGISDYDEDYDKDGISNGKEYSMGLNPLTKDTDADGLFDNDELEIYNTDPTDFDTDDDGASDGVEIDYGTNPLVPDSSFIETASSDQISEFNPVAVTVEANVSGDAVGTVYVENVDTVDNAFITESIPGYLGEAYNFTADGAINSATVTFNYDPALGIIGEDFQPRIYYFNELTQMFEELPDQIVMDGSVTAVINHFSTYILLNKVDFDAVWETEIKPPITSGDPSQTATLDIAFVIDYSRSMEDNDPTQLCKTLSQEFVDKLREGLDKGAVVKFIKTASVISDLTTDKQALKDAIESIIYDDGYGSNSGTDGSAGIYEALETLTQSGSKHKYIIFITDGEDTYHTYSYDMLISRAKEQGVNIFAIGMGTAKEDILRQLADETGGKYYYATATTDTDDIIDLEDVFKDISSETVDLTVDSNNDGIPDYYNDLIFNGDLLLSNESYQFIGYDFNYDKDGMPSDDYDGDGLKNGEELIVVQNGDKVYLKMYSNPLQPDSDLDGKDDGTEKFCNTDPLKYTYDYMPLYTLSLDDYYAAYHLAKRYDSDLRFAISVASADALSGNIDYVASCKELYLDYFYDYADDTIKADEQRAEVVSLLENTNDWMGKINKAIKTLKKLTDKGTALLQDLHELYVLRNQLETISKRMAIPSNMLNQDYIDKLTEDWLTVTESISKHSVFGKYGLDNKVPLKLKTVGNRYQQFLNKTNRLGIKNSTTISLAMSVFSTGIDVIDTIDTYAKLKANSQAYVDNLDILDYLSKNSGRDVVRAAASEIKSILISEFNDYSSQLTNAVASDLKTGAIKYAVSELVKLNPYTKAIKVTFDIFDLLIGVSNRAHRVDQALYYDSITLAVKNEALESVQIKNTMGAPSAYDCIDEDTEDSRRYLTHLAQLRIVSEENFVEFSRNKGWLTMFFKSSYKEAKAWKEEIQQKVNDCAEELGLVLAKELRNN